MQYNPKKQYRTRNGQFKTKDGTLQILASHLNQSDEVAGVLIRGAGRHLTVWSPDEHCDGLACTLCELMEDDELDLVEDVITEQLPGLYVAISPSGAYSTWKSKATALSLNNVNGFKVVEIPPGQYRVVTSVD